MLKIYNIDASYGGIQALRKVSLEVGRREVVCLVGANGAGKTTLLNVISCLHRPREGKIEFVGIDITGFTPERVVSKGIIQIPEGRELFKNLKVKENLEMGAYLRFKRNGGKEIEQDLERIFKLFPILKNRVNQLAGTLSGGEQQMLAIGRGLMSNPKLMLADEPSLGLAFSC
jgi:branched-chain amino acid transport system ATP-binding protein